MALPDDLNMTDIELARLCHKLDAENDRLRAKLASLRARFVEDRASLQADQDFGAASLLQTYINDIDQQERTPK